MRLLIAIPTCHSLVYPQHDQGAAHHNRTDNVRSSAIRNTWYKDAAGKIDVKFFYGRWPAEATRLPQDDEIFLDVLDDYYSLPVKVQTMFQWCLDEGYDQVLKCDDDVFVYIDRLLGDFRPTDYKGYQVSAVDGPYASGTAYWVSRRAMQLIVNEPWNGDWAEDKWVGKTLLKHGIALENDERFHCCHCADCLRSFPEEKRISSHTVSPERIYELMENTCQSRL